MQFLTMTQSMTLSSLSNIVGGRNVDTVLNANSLSRTVDIGKAFYNRQVSTDVINSQQKLNILNQFVGDSDIFEKAALGDESDWASLAQYNCFTDAIKIPDEVKIPSSEGVLGNGQPVSNTIYQKCADNLKSGNYIDPSIFSEYSALITDSTMNLINWQHEPLQAFNGFMIPWGEVCLYSALRGEMLYLPVYPEGFDDGVNANFDEMSEMLYQYEPWKVYKSSGPRELSFTFKFHRDMWTGNHLDGNANDLIRGCKSNCYPRYNGSLVNVSLVTLYIHGQNFITGVMTSCKANWDKPIGLDGFPLVCELSFTIVEVSPEPLDYDTYRFKGLIS